MATVFITATGTDVGKTYVAAALIRAMRRAGRKVDAIKPALTGYTDYEGSDAAILLEALGDGPERLDRMSPLRFKAALAPPSSAKLEGRTVDQGLLNQICRLRMNEMKDGLLIIEGIGGVMSPIADHATGLDIISDLEVPAVLVAGTYLGSVTHTLTAIEALKARYLPILAVVVSASDGTHPNPEEVTNALREFHPGLPWFVAPRGDEWDASPLADLIVEKIGA
jgi:dethiobiotin synthetase